MKCSYQYIFPYCPAQVCQHTFPVVSQTYYLPLFFLPCQEEEGDDADVSVAASMSSHSIPLALAAAFPPLYGARYSETTTAHTAAATYGGLVAMEDANDDDPESILDDHVAARHEDAGLPVAGGNQLQLGRRRASLASQVIAFARRRRRSAPLPAFPLPSTPGRRSRATSRPHKR